MQIKRTYVGDTLAIGALAFYLVTELLFRYSMLIVSYPALITYDVLTICECLTMGASVTALLIRPRRLSLYQAILSVVTLALLILSATRTFDYRFVHGFVLLLSVAGVDLRKLCNVYYLSVIPTIIAVMLLAILGVEFNKDVVPNNRLVFAYGFGHPNTTGCMLFSAIGAMSYAHWNKRTWIIPCLLSAIVGIFSYVSLSSHASAALSFALFAITAFGHTKLSTKLSPLPYKPTLALLIGVPMLLIVITLFSTAYYDNTNSLMTSFNNLIHGRPYYAHNYYCEHGGFTLFGQQYILTSSYHSGLPFASLDGGYSYLALVTGVAPMLALFFMYCVAASRIAKSQSNYFLALTLLMQAFYLLIEYVPAVLVLSFPILFLSEAFQAESEIEA